MIRVLRGILTALTDIAGTVYRQFTADGRVDEEITGVMYQHYGFASSPKPGADLVTLQYGNNNISVAENDGSLRPSLDPGDVALYANGAAGSFNGILIQPAGNSIDILTTDGSIHLVADGSSIINISATNVYLGAAPGDEASTYRLLNENFVSEHYLKHVHAASGLPLTEGVVSGTMLPDVLPHQTTVTKAK